MVYLQVCCRVHPPSSPTPAKKNSLDLHESHDPTWPEEDGHVPTHCYARALLHSYMLSIVTLLLPVMVWPQFAMQILTGSGSSDPKSPLPMKGLGHLSNRMLLGTTRVSLPNGISFRPTALPGCIRVADGQTDRQTDRRAVTSVAIGRIGWIAKRFQQCHLMNIFTRVRLLCSVIANESA